MAEFGAPNFLSMIDAYEAGSRRAERNRLADLDAKGRQLAGQALSGDQNALGELYSLDPERGMKVQQFTDQQKQQFVKDFANAAYDADTPEKYAAVIQRFKGMGHTFDPSEEDFGARQSMLSQAIDIGDRMGMDLRREESKRAQANSDRAFGLQERGFNADERYRQQQLALEERKLALKDNPYRDRELAADHYGLQQDSPERQAYILTGRMPQEQRSTAADRAAIREADDMAFAAQTAIGQLKEALALNDKAGSGYFAGLQSFAARNDPTGFLDDEKGKATTDFNNIVLNQALGSMKSIFGGNPTEGERAVLLDLQAAADKTPAERKAILERGIALANRRMQFQQDRAGDLRSGSYYQPRDAASGGQRQGSAPDNADDLIQQANDAIERGADPVKVRQRLQEQGVEADFGE